MPLDRISTVVMTRYAAAIPEETLGSLAGSRGLAIAWSDANGVFYKYMRAYSRGLGLATPRDRV